MAASIDRTSNPDGLTYPGLVDKKYHPILEIGSGGMSRVYLTVVRGPAGFNKFQVVKKLLPSLASDPEFLNMFLEEARLSARLNHVNVVQINEVGFDGDHHFMAMEYLEGQSLETTVRWAARRGSGLPVHLYVRVLADAAQGLHYAHEFVDLEGQPLNVVHRDVSPHNVFVTYQGQVKVLDFGIAKAADSAQQTRTGMLKGKVAYMAPEQLRRNVPPDRRADIFALGVMLWQAVAGRRLWQNMSDIEVFQMMNARQIPSLREFAPGAPAALVQICERALAYERHDRYATAAEMGDALEGFLLSEGRRVSSRELGTYVAELFASKRAELKSLLEAALTRRVDTTSQVPALPASLGHGHQGLVESHPTSPKAFARSGDAWPVGERSATNVGVHSASLPDLLTSPSRGQRPPSRSRWLWASAAVLGLGASAVSYALIKRSLARPESRPASAEVAEVAGVAGVAGAAETASAARPLPAEVAQAAAQKHTRVIATAVPPIARLFVDDVPLSSNPGSASFARDGQVHRIRAEAPGFVADAKTVIYDGDEQIVSFRLQRESHRTTSPGRPPGRSPVSTGAPPTSTPADLPAKGVPGKVAPPLDRDNPWSP